MPRQVQWGLTARRRWLLALFCGFVALPVAAAPVATLRWAGCGISKKAFMAEIAKAFEAKTGIRILLEGGGATKGIREVSAGRIDLGGSCRNKIYETNISAIKEERWAHMTPVAWDALVAIVNKNNPVSGITREQIRQIYRGQINNWSALGGADADIELYVRRGKISGVGLTLREMVFENFEEEFTGADQVVKSSGPLEKAVEKKAYALGITGVSSAKRRNVKMLELEGISPSYENIRDGKYLLYRPLYLVTPMKLEVRPEVAQFLEFVRSEEGKAVIRKVGTVPYEDAIPTWLKALSEKGKVAVGK